MSLFKKPKRNLRLRELADSDGENDSNETENQFNPVEAKPVKPKSKKAVPQQPVLSFEEDWNQGDDGEVFQVKKSSQSKKIKKLLDKERKKKKEKPDADGNIPSKEKTSQITLDDDIVIKLKNTFPILNGREAEAAAQGGISSEDEAEPTAPVHKFVRQSDNVKMLLQKGKIPDAATIHAARKQRQHVREMGEFIPVSEEPTKYDNKTSSSRFIREDDNDDNSDGEEERINMSVNVAAEDRLRRRAEFHAAQEIRSDESDKGEEDEWENQQIRKGVTGAQIAAVQQESMYYQQYMASSTISLGVTHTDLPSESMADSNSGNVFPPLPSTNSTIDPEIVAAKLKDRLADLKEVHRRHTLDLQEANDEIQSLKEESEKLKGEGPRLANKFAFYQDLRGYVTDLVECLDEKIVVVEMLEQRVESLFSRRTSECIARRRQDVMDQAQELAPVPLKSQRPERDEAQVRRVAEREGRRIRRQRARELKGVVSHIEGMSSDEEITETEMLNSKSQREVIEQDALHIFEDTLDEFSTVNGILQRFESWRHTDMDAYTEAYVSLCLPKLLGPLIRLKLLFWNPFTQGSYEIEKTTWCNNMFLFDLRRNETEDDLRNDPDCQLLPRVVDKIVLPKLTQLVTTCWDPLSSSQTVTLIGILTKFIQDYPTVTFKSKALISLIEKVIEKMKEAVDNDVYIPIYTKARFNESKVNCFFMRQCTIAVKLLGNIVRWQGLLSDSTISKVALESLLNRYLLMAIKTCQPIQAANICQMVGSALPRVWLQTGCHPPQLTQFLCQTKVITQLLDPEKPLERDALERMSYVLKGKS